MRTGTPDDAAAICRIYNEGITDRIATFETRLRTIDEVRGWFTSTHPIVVVEDDRGAVVAFASTSAYRPRDCYRGVAEFSVYTARDARRQGAGRAAILGLLDAARAAGFWKLVSRVFVENVASRRLLEAAGFREVGIYYRHAQLDGLWRDVVIVEKLLSTSFPSCLSCPPPPDSRC